MAKVGENMEKTKPCPICGNDLLMPVEYLDAHMVWRDKTKPIVETAIIDFIQNELKPVLFKLAKSHSKLSQNEYNRNPGYNNTHFSHIAETAIVAFMEKHSLCNDFIKYMGDQVR